MVKIKTVKEAKQQKKICLWFGTILIVVGILFVGFYPNPGVGIFFAILAFVLWVKMMYWDLVLRLDKSLK